MSLIKATIALFAVLFLWVQAGTVAHATQFVDQPHDHDGAVCVIVTVSGHDVALTPVPFTHDPVIHGTLETEYSAKPSIVYQKPQGRAPPPRGPPNFF